MGPIRGNSGSVVIEVVRPREGVVARLSGEVREQLKRARYEEDQDHERQAADDPAEGGAGSGSHETTLSALGWRSTRPMIARLPRMATAKNGAKIQSGIVNEVPANVRPQTTTPAITLTTATTIKVDASALTTRQLR